VNGVSCLKQWHGVRILHINDTIPAWKLIQRVNEPNLGLVIDAFHIFVRNRTIAALAGIPMENIFLVQLSDLDTLPAPGKLVDDGSPSSPAAGTGEIPAAHTTK